MIELVFIACLHAAPSACEERSIAYLAEASLAGCMLRAQPDLAHWSETHPNLHVTRWSCRYTDGSPRKA
jgi:hypothetical protein